MKIRQGFVSNSSSSSFCIFGIDIENRALRTHIMKAVKNKEGCDVEDEADIVDTLESLTKLYSTGRDGYYVIGREWSSIEDIETGADFKKDVAKKLADAIGLSEEEVLKQCGTHEDSWYNG